MDKRTRKKPDSAPALAASSAFFRYAAADGAVKVRVLFKDETAWLTPKALAELFGVGVPAVNKHLKNIFESGELDRSATVSKMEIVQPEGDRDVTRHVEFHNLDAIIAVGYRVNSYQATQFRIWATRTLRELMSKPLGFRSRHARGETARRFVPEAKRAESEQALLVALKREVDTLDALRAELDEHWGIEDGVYRFYHQSFKVYRCQAITLKVVTALRALLPGVALNAWFERIVADGTGKKWEKDHNRRWLEETRPIIEAMFHAKYMLDMACKYARELDEAPSSLPSGWAALLYLYNLR